MPDPLTPEEIAQKVDRPVPDGPTPDTAPPDAVDQVEAATQAAQTDEATALVEALEEAGLPEALAATADGPPPPEEPPTDMVPADADDPLDDEPAGPENWDRVVPSSSEEVIAAKEILTAITDQLEQLAQLMDGGNPTTDAAVLATLTSVKRLVGLHEDDLQELLRNYDFTSVDVEEDGKKKRKGKRLETAIGVLELGSRAKSRKFDSQAIEAELRRRTIQEFVDMYGPAQAALVETIVNQAHQTLIDMAALHTGSTSWRVTNLEAANFTDEYWETRWREPKVRLVGGNWS